MIENTKQVIVMRKFPNLRIGKYAAQASHASMAFLTQSMNKAYGTDTLPCFCTDTFFIEESIEIEHWLKNSFRKIICYVNTEEELLAIHQKALDYGLISHIVEDNGATEFGGVKTLTAIGIGPHVDSKFIGITDNLPLL
jgi:PTH2 family peptidyl-tRNA hydrolase